MPVLSEVVQSLGIYLKAQARIAIVVVGLYIIACAVTGVPWWLLTGFLCGVLNLIPHLGPVIALGIALFAKWCITDDLLPLVYVTGAWLLIQIVDGFVLSPRAAGKAGLNPFLSILITLGAGVLFGPIGMLLGAPVAIVLIVVVRAIRRGQRH
jgi:predicted PurR-regulated permease PerM